MEHGTRFGHALALIVAVLATACGGGGGGDPGAAGGGGAGGGGGGGAGGGGGGPVSWLLTVARAGAGTGSVASAPAGLSCGSTCGASFADGTGVTLTATPAAGSVFAGWSGDCAGAAATATVTMSAARSCTGTFDVSPPATSTLTISRTGTGSGSVTSTPPGIDCGTTCSAPFTSGATVTLTAAAAAGSTFDGWSGDCSGTNATTSVTMSAARSCTAAFAAAGGGGGADVGYHLIGQAGVAVASPGTVAFADRSLSNSAFALHAIDVSSGASTVLEPGGQWYTLGTPLVEAIGDPITATIPTVRVRLTAYAKGGRLYRVDHLAPGAAPTPVLWSSVTTGEICSGTFGANASAFNARFVFFRGPGADGACGTADDTRRAISVTAGDGDPALTVPGTLVTPLQGADGAVTGYLVWTGSQLARLDANLANPINLFAAPQLPAHVALFGGAAPSIWLFGGGALLLAYDLAAGGAIRAVSLPAGVAGPFSIVGAERNAVYLQTVGRTPTTVLRVDGSLTASTVTTFASDAVQSYLSPTRVVAKVGNEVQAAPRSGGAPVVIASPPGPQVIAYHQVVGEMVVYETREGTRRRIGIVRSDGTGARIIDNAALADTLFAAPVPYFDLGVGAVTLLEGLGTNGATAGASLRTYAGPALDLLAGHGTLPATTGGTGWSAVSPYQLGRHGLASFLIGSTLNLFLYRSDQPGLAAVTNY